MPMVSTGKNQETIAAKTPKNQKKKPFLNKPYKMLRLKKTLFKLGQKFKGIVFLNKEHWLGLLNLNHRWTKQKL